MYSNFNRNQDPPPSFNTPPTSTMFEMAMMRMAMIRDEILDLCKGIEIPKLTPPVLPAPSINKSAARSLFAAAAMAQLQIRYLSPDAIRIAVMDPESAIVDLIVCLESNPAVKSVKRVGRLQFLVKFFGPTLSDETHDRLMNVLAAVADACDDPAEEEVEVSDEELLASLKEAVAKQELEEGGDLVFDKPALGSKFTPSPKQAFHDACKVAVNADGKVYDIFTAVAIVAFEELLRGSTDKYSLRGYLLSKAKLVFKGGAAIGKFLFMNNEALWNSMIESDRTFLQEKFIQGGDNDTGIVFSVPAKEYWYTASEANAMIGQILFDMNRMVLEVVRRYQVEEIVQEYLDASRIGDMDFGGRSFKFDARNAGSFQVVEVNEAQNMVVQLERPEFRLFTSMSLLEFQNDKGDLIKFHLSRVKAAFVARNAAEDIAVNCYAECLDISASCVDSVKAHASYRPVAFNP